MLREEPVRLAHGAHTVTGTQSGRRGGRRRVLPVWVPVLPSSSDQTGIVASADQSMVPGSVSSAPTSAASTCLLAAASTPRRRTTDYHPAHHAAAPRQPPPRGSGAGAAGRSPPRGAGQIRAAPRTVRRRGQRLGSIRRHRRCQPRTLAARLPARLAIGRPLPRRTVRPPLGLGAIESADGGIEELVESCPSRASSSAIRAVARSSSEAKPTTSANSSS